MILWWDNMKSFREFIDEEIKLPIEVGDIVLGGKFKNKRIVFNFRKKLSKYKQQLQQE